MTIIKGTDIPYYSLAQDVFSEDGQMFIPFLGAGVSISDREPTAERKLTSPPPDRSEIDQALNSLRLKGKGRTFVELAVLLGYLIDLEEIETTQESTEEFQQRLMDEPYPPSASELALLFARTASYSTFVQVVRGPEGSYWFELYHDMYAGVVDRWKRRYRRERSRRQQRRAAAFGGIVAALILTSAPCVHQLDPAAVVVSNNDFRICERSTDH